MAVSGISIRAAIRYLPDCSLRALLRKGGRPTPPDKLEGL
jgi:hypothetical protein